jgi:hypothetical protein
VHLVVGGEAVDEGPDREEEDGRDQGVESVLGLADHVVFAGEVGGDAVGDDADREAKDDANATANSDEAGVGDGPVVGRGDDEGWEGVGDEEGASTDKDSCCAMSVQSSWVRTFLINGGRKVCISSSQICLSSFQVSTLLKA